MRLEKKILIVDDDDAIRALLMTVLRRRGFRVDTARNGIDAMERLRACCYALIVLDLMMPRMNGYEVLAHLSTLPANARPFVLVLTAGLEKGKFDTSLVVGTIQKPFDIELLVDTVAGCVGALEGCSQPDTCSDQLAAPAVLPEQPN
ncbi:MAG TPA: response regulator [Thermoanaerobaculia bacterium]|nr:response regulator [Thermoanaerobaculia bacterium]